jgi:signal transduction histidine kinase/DNA-binding response OmpR family regulator
MLGFTNTEYRERIATAKRALETASDADKTSIYETLFNLNARMGFLLEAEKITLEHVSLLRKSMPKGKLIVEELRLVRLMADNGKTQQALEHLDYCHNFCKFGEADNKERYLSALMGIYRVLSSRDEKFKTDHRKYFERYRKYVKPETTVDKLDTYMELAGAYMDLGERDKGIECRKKMEALLAEDQTLNDAYRDRFKNYLYQLSLTELRSNPDPQLFIKHANEVLEKNRKENFLHTAGMFFWLRNLASAYARSNNIEGLRKTFNEYVHAVNAYVEENVDNKIYEQKYQSDYFLQTQKLKDAEALNLVKDSVFSNFNHELRTPLNIILSNCELIERDAKLNASATKRLGAIQNQSYNLLNIIDQFIEINKTNLQFNQVNNETGDLVQFLQLMQSDFSTLSEQQNIKLAFDTKAIKQLVCELDFVKLERILYNLITNAIKFTAPFGEVTVKLEIDKKNNTILLSVADTGIGISAEEQQTIFQQFYSAKKDTENIKSGTGFGIGLYLVKQLTDLLAGSIEVISKIGKGSTFTVVLPLVIYKGKQKEFAVSKRLNYKHIKTIAPTEKAAVKTKPTPAKISKPLLLIVEDNSDLLEIIGASLQANFTIKTAADGEEAKALLENISPDAVITDLMMPRMNGIQLTTHIKQHPALNHIPVVMLTAKGSLPNRIKGWQAGIDVFLRKPFAIAELEYCLQNVMQTRNNAQARIELLLTTPTGKQTKPESVAEKFVSDFKSYVLTNISTDIKNAAIAKRLQIDESSMYRKIKSLTGYAPVQLVTKLKILRAKEFIEAGQFATVKEIAYNCGFNDPKYFSQVYKAEMGYLPRVVK